MKMLLMLLLMMTGSYSLTGCQNSTSAVDDDDPSEIDADYVWRVCNEHEEFAMEDIVIKSLLISNETQWTINNLASNECSRYYPDNSVDGKWPITDVSYKQDNESYLHIYLEGLRAVRGKNDTTLIRQTPGRYTYYFKKDTSRHYTQWVEIEREAYH